MTPIRQRVEAKILEVIDTIDPSGYNRNYYTTFFKSMDDSQFDVWMKTLQGNLHAKLPLYVPPMIVVISPENALKAAKLLGIKVVERLRLWDPVGKRYCVTPQEYFVLRLPVRRLKQYGLDGLSVPDSDKRLNPLTDQVVKPDKGSAISFSQAQMIAEKGLYTVLQELMNIRGGDLEAYAKMRTEIEETGDSDTSVMEGTNGVKSVQVFRTLLHALHLESNV